MIKMTQIYNKKAVFHGQNEIVILNEIIGEKINKKESKINKLNLSIAIDISSSMSYLVKPRQSFNVFNDHRYINQFNSLEVTKGITKIEQAKLAARKAVESLNNGDILSIILFNTQITILIPATIINDENKQLILNKIQLIRADGSTNLHGGWLAGANEVAKNLNKENINRVLILTDGQTNAGVVDPKEIIKNISAVYANNISTTTFGIGEDFNENLLQGISNAGGGNFYYVDDDNKLLEMFNQEFHTLSNICASEIKLTFELKNATIVKQWNELDKIDNTYILGSLGNKMKNLSLFTLKIKTKSNMKNLNLGKLIINYKNEEGVQCKEEMVLSLPIVTKDEWSNLINNEEVKIQETLLTIANNKTKATEALLTGNIEGAKYLLSGSLDYVKNSGINDNRLFAESQALSATLNSADEVSISALRKDISYQSYKTRFNK